MINTQTVKVNLIRQDYTTAFTLNQGDKGVPVKIELIDDGAPYTLLKDDIVTIEWLKPNSSPFLQEGGIKYGTNSIEITTPESIAQYSGSGSFNIIISNGDVRKGTIRREYKVVPTSMKPGSISEDVITDAITELRNLNTELAETVQNNQEIINSNSAATKTDIANVNSSLEEKASEISILKRKFKGEFGRNLYWADGASGAVAESKKKEQIEACITAGIDSVVLPIQTKYSNGNLVIVNDLDNDLKWLKYAQAHGLKVSCIKMHNYGYTSDDIASNYTDFKAQYKTIIDTVSTKFKNLNIDIFTVMNEETQYFMGMDNADNSFILDLFTTVKAQGFKVGITTAGYNYSYRVSENILSNSDVICANTYVRIGSKRERTTDLDSIRAWQEDDINMWITYMKGKYPDKEIILSETGCMDYWAGLQTPSSFVYPDELKVTTNNKAVDIYYAGMFETMSEKVDRVWNWFNLPSVDVCKKYLTGGYANE